MGFESSLDLNSLNFLQNVGSELLALGDFVAHRKKLQRPSQLLITGVNRSFDVHGWAIHDAKYVAKKHKERRQQSKSLLDTVFQLLDRSPPQILEYAERRH